MVTYESGTAKTYVDGTLIDSRGMSINTGSSDGGQIGARIQPTEYFSGYIDEVGVWNRALSAAEVSQLYNNGAGLNPLGKSVVGGLAGEHGPLPTVTSLGINYPNPFNPETIIEYDVAGLEQVRLEIFNILGQQVRVLVDAPQAQGRYQAVWDGRDMGHQEAASGMYFYRLTTPTLTQTRKMVLVR